MDELTPQEIDKAHERIFSLIIKTPLISSETINKKTNANVYFKLENLQWTGSFKLRGASNKISQLSNEEKSRGIVSYSSGNHAQAVAYASNLFDVQATIVMPKNAPSIKIENTKKRQFSCKKSYVKARDGQSKFYLIPKRQTYKTKQFD